MLLNNWFEYQAVDIRNEKSTTFDAISPGLATPTSESGLPIDWHTRVILRIMLESPPVTIIPLGSPPGARLLMGQSYLSVNVRLFRSFRDSDECCPGLYWGPEIQGMYHRALNVWNVSSIADCAVCAVPSAPFTHARRRPVAIGRMSRSKAIHANLSYLSRESRVK